MHTYFVRGGVFANAQTANVVKLGIAAAGMNIERCLFYLWPIPAFTAGVMLSLWIEDQSAEYPRRLVPGVEILFMVIIAFPPVSETLNIIANIMVSFLCAMQMQTFQIFRRHGIATTVVTGNLRKAVDCLYKAIKEKDRKQLRISMTFFSIILLFITGVILGTPCSLKFSPLDPDPCRAAGDCLHPYHRRLQKIQIIQYTLKASQPVMY